MIRKAQFLDRDGVTNVDIGSFIPPSRRNGFPEPSSFVQRPGQQVAGKGQGLANNRSIP